jgi:sugar-phosphatase
MTNEQIIINCKAILFDLDGVLLDSTSCIERHWQEWAEKHGLELKKVLQNAHGVRTIETIRLVAPHLDAEREAADFTANEILDTEGVVAIPGAKELMEHLPPGKWAIVTSGGFDLVQARLKKADLPMPKHIVSADDVTQGKPSPQPYLIGANKLGITINQCVVVEDAPIGIKAGKAAGMKVIGITSTHPVKELIDAGVDFLVESLKKIRISENIQNHSIKIGITTL